MVVGTPRLVLFSRRPCVFATKTDTTDALPTIFSRIKKPLLVVFVAAVGGIFFEEAMAVFQNFVSSVSTKKGADEKRWLY